MDKDAILAFMKKNMLSLTCAVVALLAVVAYFYPLGGMVEDLQQKATEKSGLYGSLQAFLKPRKLPVNSLDAAEPAKFDTFPNTATLKQGQAAVDKWKEDSDNTVKNLIAMNKAAHPLLLRGELPFPEYQPDFFNFAKLYLSVLSTDPTVSGLPKKDAKPVSSDDAMAVDDRNLQNDILHGATPPSVKDISEAEIALWQNNYVPLIIEQNGKQVNITELTAAYTLEKAGLPLRLKKKAADTLKIYVDYDAFSINSRIKGDIAPTPEDIWYCQTQVWVERDIALAIAEANAGSANILEAPVKRLLSVSIQQPPSYTRQQAVSGAPGQPGPVAPTSDTAPIVPDYTASPSGRYCNAMYDVVPFTLYVDVEASKMNQFIETLSKGRFMTVLTQDEWALNAENEFRNGFLYGHGAVVRLHLTGESLFFRGWTAPGGPKDPMPMEVKTTLGLIAATPGTPAAGPPPQGQFNPGMGGGRTGYGAPIGPGAYQPR